MFFNILKKKIQSAIKKLSIVYSIYEQMSCVDITAPLHLAILLSIKKHRTARFEMKFSRVGFGVDNIYIWIGFNNRTVPKTEECALALKTSCLKPFFIRHLKAHTTSLFKYIFFFHYSLAISMNQTSQNFHTVCYLMHILHGSMSYLADCVPIGTDRGILPVQYKKIRSNSLVCI